MLGLDRHVPDETQVVVRPPLTLPPDYDLVPPGTPSAVSSEHETAQSMAETGGGAAQPKKEERGFFGRLWHLDFFGDDSTSTTPAPSVDGTPKSDAPTTPPAAPGPEAGPPKE